MADAVAAGDHVIPRSIIGTSLDGSGLLAQPPITGIVTAASGTASILWSTGKLITSVDVSDTTDCPLLRVATPSSTTLFGQVVQLIGANPEFSGPVVQELSIELDPAGSAGTFTDCVLVRSRGPSQAYFIAAVTNVAVVD